VCFCSWLLVLFFYILSTFVVNKRYIYREPAYMYVFWRLISFMIFLSLLDADCSEGFIISLKLTKIDAYCVLFYSQDFKNR